MCFDKLVKPYPLLVERSVPGRHGDPAARSQDAAHLRKRTLKLREEEEREAAEDAIE